MIRPMLPTVYLLPFHGSQSTNIFMHECRRWCNKKKHSFLPFLQPPVELRYPGYRGAMKLSYINDMPVSLFNYKRNNNLDAKQPIEK